MSRRRSIYYGWVCMVLGAFAMVGTLPGRTQGLGLVTAPMLESLHLDQVRFATTNLIATLVGAGFALPAGWLIDRAGLRLAVPLVELALGLVVVAMARVEGLLALGLLLTLTRGLGQTALSIGSMATVGKWFGRRLSVAMGVYSLVLGCGFIAAFPGVQKAAEVYGWRAAWSGVGWGLVVLAILSALLLRGPRPDEDAEERRVEDRAEPSIAFADALRMPAFWVYALTSALYLLVASATSLFTELMLRERGLSSEVFRAALATTALVGILANFVGGFIGARIALPKLLAISSLLVAPCLCAYPFIATAGQAVAWAAGLGAAGGIVTVVFFTIWGRLFGPAQLGQIQGLAQALTVLGSALGPVVFAASAERFGSYTPAFLALTPALVLGAVACWWVAPPSRG